MAPLDTGSISHLRVVEPLGRATGPRAEAYSTLGAFLQAAREHRGVTLGAIADETRIRIEHLKAIEADDFGALPSRPFAIGYVRAIARMLELDAEACVERFRREHPAEAVTLQPPVGMVQKTDDRRPVAYAAIGALVAAVVLWNIAQRVLHTDEGPPRPDLAPAVAAAQPVEAAGPIKLSAPTPAPAEQGLPAPYITPGMDEAHPIAGAAPASGPTPAASTEHKLAEGLLTAPAAPRSFETRGAIYGEAAGRSPALLVARTPASLVVRGADGRIWFARQLAQGEAYRVPLGRGLTADISDPAAVDLYVGGQLRGALTTLQTPLDKVAGAFVGVTPAALQPAIAPGGRR